ncbi:PREDICTED: uncharacterized protein LOC109131727, partial [Camelina sativa]|uniref:Uncharacterized protein LOC109131727 n=1 Tax=Camelina sativa TaxID=90675 RepID=A0ABM1RHF7_CAMSA
MYCNYCKESNNIGIISEATKIAGRRAADVLKEAMEAAEKASYAEISLQTPECLKHIIGTTCKFQIKLSEYNFKTSRQTVSISRILETITDLPTETVERSSE